MRSINTFLFTLSILPFSLILLISTLNLEKKSNLKVLVWTIPPLELGYLTAIGSTLGFISSFIIVNLPDTNSNTFQSRRVISKPEYQTPYIEQPLGQTNYADNFSDFSSFNYIERDPRDPSPTVSIPYKIVQKARPRTSDDSSAVNSEYIYRNDNIAKQSADSSKEQNNTDDWLNEQLENW